MKRKRSAWKRLGIEAQGRATLPGGIAALAAARTVLGISGFDASGALHIDLTEFEQAKDYFSRAVIAMKAAGDQRARRPRRMESAERSTIWAI